VKKCIAITITTLACLTGFGQGTVNFANLAPAGLNLPIYLNDGVTRLFGPQYRAGLFAGPHQAQLSLIATVPFLSGGGAGYFNGGVVVITNVVAGGAAWIQVVAWDTTLGGTTTNATFFQAQASGLPVWGASSVFSVVTGNPFGSPATTPATLWGLTNDFLVYFNTSPPRMVPALTMMGQPGSALNLDATDTLVPAPKWAALDSVMLTNSPQWYFDLSAPLPPQRFYRAWQSGVLATPVLDARLIPALTLTGSVGSHVRVDGINQFGPTNAWFTLDTVTLTNASQLYFDTSAIGQPPRLYRVVQLP
jgi:hypothetical protein